MADALSYDLSPQHLKEGAAGTTTPTLQVKIGNYTGADRVCKWRFAFPGDVTYDEQAECDRDDGPGSWSIRFDKAEGEFVATPAAGTKLKDAESVAFTFFKLRTTATTKGPVNMTVSETVDTVDRTVTKSLPLTAAQMVITSFWAQPVQVGVNQATTLHWDTEGADDVTIIVKGGQTFPDLPVRGQREMPKPALGQESITYELMANKHEPQQHVSSYLVVGVSRAVARISIDKPAVDVGQTATLQWKTLHATEARLNGVELHGQEVVSGQRKVLADQTTRYELVAKGPGQDNQDQDSVTLHVNPVEILEFSTRQPETGAIPLTWRLRSAIAALILPRPGWVDPGTASAAQTAIDRPARDTTYTLTAYGPPDPPQEGDAEEEERLGASPSSAIAYAKNGWARGYSAYYFLDDEYFKPYIRLEEPWMLTGYDTELLAQWKHVYWKTTEGEWRLYMTHGPSWWGDPVPVREELPRTSWEAQLSLVKDPVPPRPVDFEVTAFAGWTDKGRQFPIFFNRLERSARYWVEITVRNTGTQAWAREGSAADLVTYPAGSASPFRDDSWPAADVVARLDQTTVNLGQEATYRLWIKAPAPGVHVQRFQLRGRDGPFGEPFQLRAVVV